MGGAAGLLCQLISKIFSKDASKHSLSNGIFIGDKLVRFPLQAVLADEKGLKDLYDVRFACFFILLSLFASFLLASLTIFQSCLQFVLLQVKGASGSHPCLLCRNILRVKRPDIIGGFAKPLSASFNECELHTAAAFQECIQTLRERKDTTTVAVFEDFFPLSFVFSVLLLSVRFTALEHPVSFEAAHQELQQCLGINYNERSVLFDEIGSQLVCPVEMTVFDWMHTFYSNGVAETSLTLFYNTILAPNGVTPALLENFKGTLHLPYVMPSLVERWKNDHQSWTLQASEVKTLIHIVRCFIDSVPDLVQDHPVSERCFRSLDMIGHLLERDDAAWGDVNNLLQQTIARHHQDFLAAYGEDGVKPKYHFAIHVAPALHRNVFKAVHHFV